jgi:hypothetical protein
MAKNLVTTGRFARARLRSMVTSVLLILISIMIVRDILVRRWSGSPQSRHDTTQQSR